MGAQKFVAIKNQADTATLELFFLDIIQDSFDWFTGVTSPVQDVIDKVNFYKPSTIKVVIDSDGGDAQKGIAIYNFLKRYDAKVEVEIIGLAASIASVIAMAANKGKLRIAKNAFMMIHNAEGVVAGTSDDIRKGADLVDLYTSQIVDIYVQRTGKTAEEIAALMTNGDYWMTGEQAVEQGFADATFNDNTNVISIAARLDSSHYKNIPQQIRAQLTPEPTQTFIQTQFSEMKKFFTEIVNSIRGIKPVDGQPIQNQLADAVLQPFEKLGDEMEAQITNRVSEAVKGDAGKAAITAQLTAYLGTEEGKVTITAMLKPLVDAATADLKKKNEDMETEITNLKGGQSSASAEEGKQPTVVGKWN
jgi:ATP-dependent Clp protease protease subunit